MARKKSEQKLKEESVLDERKDICEDKCFKTDKNKLDIIKEVVANQKKRECDKQRQIYDAMNRITVERKG